MQHSKSGWRINMTSDLYYVPAKHSAFSTLKNINHAAKQSKLGKNPGEIKSWLEMQDAYTLHKPLRRRFARNPYTVDKLLDDWEADLVYVVAFNKFNDKYKYLLTVIDVFSKFLHIVPLKSKVGTA